VVTERRTYATLVYLLAGLPLGIVWFTMVVTGVSVGVSMLAVALLGVPILLGLWYGMRACANVERAAANALLGCDLPMALVASLHAVRALGDACGRWARSWIGAAA
jgi:hypothetical protein